MKYVQRYQKRVAVGIILGIVGLFCFYQLTVLLLSRQAHPFTEGMVGQYRKDDLPEIVGNLTSMGLTKVTPDGQATASAALDWHVSSDGKTYTFTLNPTLKWQDGSSFTASDLRQLFSGGQNDVQTRVITPDQIQFKLNNSYSPFPLLLTKPLYKGNTLIGLGQWQITNIEQNAGYLSAITLVNQKDATQSMVFRFYPTVHDLLTAYKLGELHALTGLLQNGMLSQWNNFSQYRQVTHTSQVTLFFNVRDGLLADKTVRQALSYAIQKDSMPGDVSFSPIPPTSWAFNSDIKQYVFDTNHAKELLKQANVATNTAITLTATPSTQESAQLIADSWRKIGLTVNVQIVTDIPKDFQAMVLMQAVSPDPDQYALWHSLQKETNISGYSQVRIDKLLEDGRTIQDLTIRKQKYFDFQRFLVEDDPALFLYYPYQTLYINKQYDEPFYRQINGFQ